MTEWVVQAALCWKKQLSALCELSIIDSFCKLFDTYHFSWRCQSVAHNKALYSFCKWPFKHYLDTIVCISYDKNSNEPKAMFYYAKMADSSKRNRNTILARSCVITTGLFLPHIKELYWPWSYHLHPSFWFTQLSTWITNNHFPYLTNLQ